jgi:hypothetical protein
MQFNIYTNVSLPLSHGLSLQLYYQLSVPRLTVYISNIQLIFASVCTNIPVPYFKNGLAVCYIISNFRPYSWFFYVNIL